MDNSTVLQLARAAALSGAALKRTELMRRRGTGRSYACGSGAAAQGRAMVETRADQAMAGERRPRWAIEN